MTWFQTNLFMNLTDGVMKWWEQDTGKHMLTSAEHRGWVTDLRYWTEQKLLLSCANDGMIVAWGGGGNVVDKIKVKVLKKWAFCLIDSYETSLSSYHQITHGFVLSTSYYTGAENYCEMQEDYLNIWYLAEEWLGTLLYSQHRIFYFLESSWGWHVYL